ncbi:MAG TPA: hypothetical protein VKP11_02130, partial [Frankiaceae bacterium]|nr:hypothetical protein [Frankiaceae bacterium]
LPIRRGKGSQPRNAPIKADLRPILSRWIAVRRDWPGADTCALWLSTQGRRAAGSTLLDRVFARSARPPTCRCPRTRCGTPSAANDNLRAGVDPATVAAWLGHDDLRTLMVYGKPTRAAMERLAETVTYQF